MLDKIGIIFNFDIYIFNYILLCFDMLSSIPIPARVIAKEEPPSDIKGRVMPVKGIKPQIAAMLIRDRKSVV